MKRVIALGAMVMLMVLALAAEATPVGPDDAEGQAFLGKRIIEIQGSAAMFDAPCRSRREPPPSTRSPWREPAPPSELPCRNRSPETPD